MFLLVGSGGAAVGLADRSRATTSLHLLDVGQGDAILLRSGSADILVDGGPDATVLQRLGEIRPAWDRRLEVLVLTHPQQDHFAGFLPLLEREDVGLLLLPRVPYGSALFRAFVEDVIARGVPVRFAEPGQRIHAGALTLTVLAPGARALALGGDNANNGAIVLRVDAGSFSALLTADIERLAEQLLAAKWGENLDVDVLKVAHHGSKTSTSLQLLRAATPALALISAGAGNNFGHPHRPVLERLRSIPVLRTDLHGTVSIIALDNNSVLVCQRGCTALAAR